MKTGLIIIILIVVILLFMAAGWYVMNKIDGFMNRTRRTNDKDTMPLPKQMKPPCVPTEKSNPAALRPVIVPLYLHQMVWSLPPDSL